HLGNLVDNLVHGIEKEIAILDVGDGPQAHDGRPESQPENAGFGDGRINDPLPEVLLQPERHREGSAPAAANPDVLAHAKDAFVAGHFFMKALAKGLRNRQMSHRAPSPQAKISSSACSGLGSGAAIAVSTACSISASTSAARRSSPPWSATPLDWRWRAKRPIGSFSRARLRSSSGW